jgi:hypothetical protein
LWVWLQECALSRNRKQNAQGRCTQNDSQMRRPHRQAACGARAGLKIFGAHGKRVGHPKKRNPQVPANCGGRPGLQKLPKSAISCKASGLPPRKAPFANPAQCKPARRPDLKRAIWRKLRRDLSLTMFAQDDREPSGPNNVGEPRVQRQNNGKSRTLETDPLQAQDKRVGHPTKRNPQGPANCRGRPGLQKRTHA